MHNSLRNRYLHWARNSVLKIRWQLRKIFGRTIAKWISFIIEDILIGDKFGRDK